MLLLLLSEAGLEVRHLLLKASDAVLLVHVHRLQQLQLCTLLGVLQLTVLQVNLSTGCIDVNTHRNRPRFIPKATRFVLVHTVPSRQQIAQDHNINVDLNYKTETEEGP